MFLTDHQWSLLSPLFPAASQGRPSLDHRTVLELIFLKLHDGLPWYDLPSASPSWQTCYQRYHLWRRTGLWNSILRTLMLDLSTRGSLDLESLIHNRQLTVQRLPCGKLSITCPASLQDTWQLTTAILIILMLFPDL